MKTHPTKNDLPSNIKTTVIAILNENRAGVAISMPPALAVTSAFD